MTDREMPWAPESETAVLSIMLQDADAARDARDLLRPEHFHRERNRLVFASQVSIVDRGDVPDVALVHDQLRSDDHLDGAGGAEYLAELVDAVTGTDLQAHAKRVREMAALRELVRSAEESVREARQAKPGEAEKVLDRAESRVLQASERLVRDGADYHRAPELVTSFLERVAEAKNNPGGVTGLPSGFPDLDRMTGGLEPGNLYVVAGRPSMGKTALAGDLARHAALRKDASVAVVSLEMPAPDVMGRMLCAEARVPYAEVTAGRVGDVYAHRLQEAARRVREANLQVVSPGSLGLYGLRAMARRIRSREGLDLLVVDYLQLMSGPADAGNREQEVAALSRGLKALALELQIPVVALSQLSRAPENRPGSNRPRLSDLRESGAIEQDADVVLFLFREERYVDPTDPRYSEVEGEAELIVGKQRNGPTGTVGLYFRAESISFDSKARGEAVA